MSQNLEYERVGQEKGRRSWRRICAVTILGIGSLAAATIATKWLLAEPGSKRYNTASRLGYSPVMSSFGDRLKLATQGEVGLADAFDSIRVDLLLDDDQSPTHFVAKHVTLIHPVPTESQVDQYPFLLGLSFQDEYAKEVIIIYAPGRGAIAYSVGAAQELYGSAAVETIRVRSKG